MKRIDVEPTSAARQRYWAGDPVADAAILSLQHAAPRGSAPANGDLLAAVEARAAAGDHACRAFVVAVSVPPRWVDPELLAAGQRLGLSLAVPTGMVLLLGGLTEVYGVNKIAGVLGSTGRLDNSTWRRMLETGRFIRDIHRPGALAPGGTGARAIARIRLIHSMVRVRGRDDDLLTQREMAFTLCAHSHVVRRGLGSLGLQLTDFEARAHQHLWRLVGHLMGVDPRLLPNSPASERTLYKRLYPALVDGSSAASQRLVARSIETVAQRSHLPRDLVRASVHRLAGHALASRLGVPSGRRWERWLGAGSKIAALLNRVRRVAPPITRLFAALGHAFANVVVARDPAADEPVGMAAARGCAAASSPTPSEA